MVTWIFDIVALTVFCLLFYIMISLTRDTPHLRGPMWLQRGRNTSYLVVCGVPLAGIISQGYLWEPSWSNVVFVGSSLPLLMFEAITLWWRSPRPESGGRVSRIMDRVLPRPTHRNFGVHARDHHDQPGP